MQDIIGELIGERYRVTAKIGEGGMAAIYTAVDSRLDRVVAIKLINRDMFSQDTIQTLLKRFEREARALAKLSHPNIVSVHDFGEYQGSPYLVMEFIEGGTLRDRMGSPKPYQEAARLLAPIANALDYAHRNRIIHRDIKPSNILLRRDGTPMLSDFGIAKVVQDEGATDLTGVGASIGTPEYMSPEQWLGKVVPQTDIYSLGIVFYELLTGRKPYSGATPAEVLIKVNQESLPSPRLYVPDLPDAVVNVLYRALAKDPAARFHTMAEFEQVLISLAEGELEQETMLRSPAADNIETVIRTPAADPISPLQYGETFVVPKPPPPVQPQAGRAADSGVGKRILVGSFMILGLMLCILFIGVGAVLGYRQFFSSTLTPTRRVAQVSRTPTPQSPPEVSATPPIVKQEITPQQAASEITPTLTSTHTPTLTLTISSTPTALSGGQTIVTRVSPKDGMVQVYVPEGEFTMGIDKETEKKVTDGRNEPAHQVMLDAFWIDQTEVTNRMFEIFVQDTGYVTYAEQIGRALVYDFTDDKWHEMNGAFWRRPFGPGSSITGMEDHPVLQVNWRDAYQYCAWANRRLPTEAEWEKAARGTDGRIYPWGNQPPSGNLLNFKDLAFGSYGDQTINDTYRFTAPAGSFPDGASPYGALDMAGNAWEWVNDWYDPEYYSDAATHNPTGPVQGEHRVLRGGGYNLQLFYARTFHRFGRDPEMPSDRYGFRCASSN